MSETRNKRDFDKPIAILRGEKTVKYLPVESLSQPSEEFSEEENLDNEPESGRLGVWRRVRASKGAVLQQEGEYKPQFFRLTRDAVFTLERETIAKPSNHTQSDDLDAPVIWEDQPRKYCVVRVDFPIPKDYSAAFDVAEARFLVARESISLIEGEEKLTIEDLIYRRIRDFQRKGFELALFFNNLVTFLPGLHRERRLQRIAEYPESNDTHDKGESAKKKSKTYLEFIQDVDGVMSRIEVTKRDYMKDLQEYNGSWKKQNGPEIRQKFYDQELKIYTALRKIGYNHYPDLGGGG